ncbi:hypothetical protein ACHAPO_005286 [Fusarium lateritium]
MPRPAKKGICNTCRRDQALPICGQCTITGLYCDRSEKPTRFIEHRELPDPDTPRNALQNQNIARLFHSYVSDISKWYDLSDSAFSFGQIVPTIALDEPLLFSAIIALSAMQTIKTSSPSFRKVAEFYHHRCVRLLITLSEGDQLITRGIALAATCLLRSYEILDGDVDPNMHLRGAYSMASIHDVLSGNLRAGLLGAGFWNYLREDITFSLFENCPLKMNLDNTPLIIHHESDQDYLNSITLILAAILHYYLVTMTFICLHGRLETLEGLGILNLEVGSKEQILENFAREICGIAFTAKISSVLVNAFGPIAFCARFIRQEPMQQEVIRQLLACKPSIGWPVERLANDLQTHWATL